MRRQLLIIIAAVALLLALSIYFGRGGDKPLTNKVQVTASFYVPAEFARRVGGDRVDVITIAPPGIEPHDFEPTAKQVRQVFSSKVFLFNGAGFDPWAEKIEKEVFKEGILIQNLSGHFRLKKMEASQTAKGAQQGRDPHIWLDPVLAQKEVRVIRDSLIKADPGSAAYYRLSAARYSVKLAALDTSFRTGLKDCATRKVVTSHAAFGYLAKRYGLKVFPIAISPNEEPSGRRIGEVAGLVKREKIRYIFFETLASPKVTETIARETGAKALEFNPIEGLSAADAAKGENYISLMEKNLKNLRKALECR